MPSGLEGTVVGWAVWIAVDRSGATLLASFWRNMGSDIYVMVGSNELPTSPAGRYDIDLTVNQQWKVSNSARHDIDLSVSQHACS